MEAPARHQKHHPPNASRPKASVIHPAATWEKVGIFVFGVVFITALLGLAVLFPNPTDFQYMVFRIVLALASAGVAALIPGFLEIKYKKVIRAGGALAVLVLVYFYNPASMLHQEHYLRETARTFYDSGRYHEAIGYYYQAMFAANLKHGEDRRDLGMDLNNLGMAWERLLQYQTAVEYYEKALVSHLKAYGAAHANTRAVQDNLSRARQKLEASPPS